MLTIEKTNGNKANDRNSGPYIIANCSPNNSRLPIMPIVSGFRSNLGYPAIHFEYKTAYVRNLVAEL